MASNDERIGVLETRQDQTSQDIATLQGHQSRVDAAITGLVSKLDQLIVASTKTQATWDAVIGMIKAAPVVVTVLAVLIGGMIWLIKHA